MSRSKKAIQSDHPRPSKASLLSSPTVPDTSPELLPSDHLKTLLEFLRLAGPGGADLARRWVAALMAIPPDEREAAVDAVEQRVVVLYRAHSSQTQSHSPAGTECDEQTLHVADPPVERQGFVEQTIRTYAATPRRKPGPAQSTKPSRRASGA